MANISLLLFAFQTSRTHLFCSETVALHCFLITYLVAKKEEEHITCHIYAHPQHTTASFPLHLGGGRRFLRLLPQIFRTVHTGFCYGTDKGCTAAKLVSYVPPTARHQVEFVLRPHLPLFLLPPHHSLSPKTGDFQSKFGDPWC